MVSERSESEGMEDERIIELFFSRDEAAIRAAEEKYGRYCMRVAMNILNDRQDAEECVNDAWRRTWDVIPPERPRELRQFLGRIVRNLSLDRWRAQHTARRNRDLEVAMDQLAECAAVPEEDEGQLTALFDQFLRGLEKEERVIFVQRYWYNLKPEQIAEGTGRGRGAVVAQLYRTRGKLKAFLTERGYSI